MEARVHRDGGTLVFTGRLDRASVTGLWRTIAGDASRVEAVRLHQVEAVDSAGIALLAELAARSPGGLVVDGAPAGLAELRTAYRLDEQLRFD